MESGDRGLSNYGCGRCHVMRHCPTEYPKKCPPLHACPRLRKLIVSVAFGSLADIAVGPRHVRFTPKSGHCGARLVCVLCQKHDHLVGPREQRRRHGEAKLLFWSSGCPGWDSSNLPLEGSQARGAHSAASECQRVGSGLQQASVHHCLLLPSKRIGRTKVRSVSGMAAGGGGNGAARVIRESASASSTAEPELLMI